MEGFEPVTFGAERVHHMDSSVKPYVLYLTVGEDVVAVKAKSHKVEKRRDDFRMELSGVDFKALHESIQISNEHLDFFDNGGRLWGIFGQCLRIGIPVGKKNPKEIPADYVKLLHAESLGLDERAQALRDRVHWHFEVPMDQARWDGLCAVLDTVLRDSHAKGTWTDGNPMQVKPGTVSPVLTP